MNEIKLKWIRVLLISVTMILAFTACGEETGVIPPPIDLPVPTPTWVPVVSESPGNIPVYIPAGEFLMGSGAEDPDTQDDEFPQHEILTSGFWIFKGEVTNAMYEECVEAGECVPPVNMDESPSQHYGDPDFANHPVVGVSWEQAKNFCDTQNGRLPTEAEWEKTARGLFGQWFPWGNEDASCDLTNMSGCLDQPDTQPEGTYPEGESPFHVFDMAGNVGEWVSDWYEPMYYDESPHFNPEGPEDGKLRVARGGSWQDEASNVRTAARFALDPENGYPNIGFRCVIVPLGGAPLCRPSYVPFCTPTTDDGCEEGGEPGKPSITQVGTTGEPVGQTGGGGIKVTGIGCPNKGLTEFYLTVGMDVPAAYTVTLNGNPIDCQPVEGYPQRLYCVVPAMESQTSFEFIFCVSNPVGGATSSCRRAALVETSVEPVNFEKRLSDSLATVVASPRAMIVTNPDGNCDEGYTYNPTTGQCERDPGTNNCPPGTNFAAANFNCVPTNDGDCPQGTTYNANLGGCVPDDGEDCPERFVLAANQTCIPDTNNGDGICPPGYYFNRRINCCAPIPNNNYDCPEGTFLAANLQRCMPTDQNGCPYGTIYDPLMGCVRDENGGWDYTQPEINFPENDDCPPGTYAVQVNDKVTVCVPEGQNGPTTAGTPECYQGYHMDNSGACVPDEPPDTGEPDCGPNGYYTAAGVPCSETDDNGCRQGYHWDGKRCVPNTGTGSPCPLGYSYSQRLRCCLPNPGNDGSTCPEDGEQTGQGTPGTTNQNGNQTPAGVTPGAGNVTSFAATGFNPNSGLCDPVEDNPCNPGYHLNENKVCVPDTPPDGQDNCPPGTTAAPVTAFVTPGTCIPDDPNECPQGTYRDTSTGACIPTNGPNDPVGQCGENQYFDRELGYCVRRNDDCCRQGYYYNRKLGYCVPLEPGPRDPGQPECPLYTRWNGQMCVPMNELTQPECWSVSGRTPTCDGPCLYPLVQNRQTGECYDPNAPQEPADTFNCRKTYLDEKSCEDDVRCDWHSSPTGGPEYCEPH